MTKFRAGPFVIIAGIALSGLYFWEKQKNMSNPENALAAATEEFRQKEEDRLRSPAGWLSVVGLHWLLGKNEIVLGAKSNNAKAANNFISLPTPVPAKLGSAKVKKGIVHLKILTPTFTTTAGEVKPVLVGDAVAEKNKSYTLKDDAQGEPTMVNIGPVTFYVIKRKNGLGFRIKNENSEARQNFQGRTWFPAKAEYIIDAEWITHSTPKALMVPDILGNINEEKSPGFARFQLEGRQVELHPTAEDTKLFFVFRDKTSGKKTYGAARFLYAEAPVNGRIKLDFNRAVNPPCAFTNYATCPMPPKENILDVAIAAGELPPPGHH